jgi:beta-ureidopropionase
MISATARSLRRVASAASVGARYDNHVYMAAWNGVGSDEGGNYFFGHSIIVDPIAHKLAQARGTEEVISATLDPGPIKRITYSAASPMIFDHL